MRADWEEISRSGKDELIRSEAALRTGWRIRHHRKSCFRVLAEPGKYEGNVVTGVPVAGAGNHHAIAVQLSCVRRRLQSKCDFCPGRERRGASKFKPVFVDDDRIS